MTMTMSRLALASLLGVGIVLPGSVEPGRSTSADEKPSGAAPKSWVQARLAHVSKASNRAADGNKAKRNVEVIGNPVDDDCVLSTSFELVYFDSDKRFEGRTPFIDRQRPSFSTEQRIEYLARYAGSLQEARQPGSHGSPVAGVSEKECQDAVAKIKERPLPEARRIIPLKYWKWRLWADDEPTKRWARNDYDDGDWNELQTPRVFTFNRDLLLRTDVAVGNAEMVWLQIDSILDEYQVFVNGEPAASHQGYEPVTFDITPMVRTGKRNCLAIRVKHKGGEPLGLAGSVRVILTKKTLIENVFCYTEALEKNCDASLRVRTNVANHLGSPLKGKLKISISEWFPEETGNESTGEIALDLNAGEEKEFETTIRIKAANLWSPSSPSLYKVHAEIFNDADEIVDDMTDVFGIRTIEEREGKIYLNNKEFFLKSFGANLGFAPAYDYHGDICPSDRRIVKDMLLCREANANTMRIHPWGFLAKGREYNNYGWGNAARGGSSGYPTDGTNWERIPYIADQLGVCLFWGTRQWTLWPSGFNRNIRAEDMERLLGSSIKHVRNHPSIIIHEGVNEVSLSYRFRHQMSEKEKSKYRHFIDQYVNIVNSVDGSRLVLPDTPFGPRFNELYPEHVLSKRNVIWTDHRYIGWYEGFEVLYKNPETRWFQRKEKPFVLAECGAEAMPDWENYREMPWYGIWLNHGTPTNSILRGRVGRPLRILKDSEVNVSQAYQGLCIQQTASVLRTSAWSGMSINLIADGLAQGLYHKGVTDLYRRPKLGFYAARMCYQDFYATGMDGDFIFSPSDTLHLKVINDKQKPTSLKLRVAVRDRKGNMVDGMDREVAFTGQRVLSAGEWKPAFPKSGFYVVEYVVVEDQTPDTGS